MDAKSIGQTIAMLRRKSGMTQSELAGRLHISDKTVSKWEGGYGYPEITQFPTLAALFGVSIDYLMTGERRGITVAGNLLTDIVKSVDSYPEKGMLSHITQVTRSVGGCAANTSVDLAKIDRSIPVSVIGRIGNDEYGRYVISELQHYGINTGDVTVSESRPTSFSDVMSLPSGERTFFHMTGANAEFSPDDIDISSLNCSILHIGYILLLDRFDSSDDEYGTVMAHFLHDVSERGIKTSIDAVSSNSGNFADKMIPPLKYADYVIVNEIESCQIFGLDPRKPDGAPNMDSIRTAAEKMVEHGVRSKVIIHSKEMGCCLDASSGEFTIVPSLLIPKSEIMGSCGAGDAFCAGCLYGIYNEYSDDEMLRFASAAAACSLFADNAVDGMRSRAEIIKAAEKYPRASDRYFELHI